MRIFRAEFNNNYLTYTFGYAEYALMESVSELHLLYQNGFLPFSANIMLNYPVFYLARSLRVDSVLFSDTSENRRVNRKMSEFEPGMERKTLTTDIIKDEKLLNFCLSYTEERFTNNAMSRERLEYIFGCGINRRTI